MISQGAVWMYCLPCESMKPHSGVGGWEDNPRSHCHDMLGHIAEWFYNGIAGIRPLEPGFRNVLIKPYLPPSINELECVYQAAAGDIRVSMQRMKEGIALYVSTSPGISCKIDRSDLQSN